MLPGFLSNFKAIWAFQQPISQLRDFTRSCETVVRFLTTGSGMCRICNPRPTTWMWWHSCGHMTIQVTFFDTYVVTMHNPQWASYQIHKIAGAHAPGMPGTFSPSPQVSDPGMHHGTCVTHVPWCMPGSLTNGFLWNRRRGKTFPAFPAHAQPAILHIW